MAGCCAGNRGKRSDRCPGRDLLEAATSTQTSSSADAATHAHLLPAEPAAVHRGPGEGGGEGVAAAAAVLVLSLEAVPSTEENVVPKIRTRTASLAESRQLRVGAVQAHVVAGLWLSLDVEKIENEKSVFSRRCLFRAGRALCCLSIQRGHDSPPRLLLRRYYSAVCVNRRKLESFFFPRHRKNHTLLAVWDGSTRVI